MEKGAAATAPSILQRVRALEERVPALAERAGRRGGAAAGPPPATLLGRVEALEAGVGALLALQVRRPAPGAAVPGAGPADLLGGRRRRRRPPPPPRPPAGARDGSCPVGPRAGGGRRVRRPLAGARNS